MLGSGHLGGNKHSALFLHAFQPGQGRLAVALETAGLGAGLPHAGTENLYAFLGQCYGGVHYLFFAFGAAWAGNHEGAVLVQAVQSQFLYIQFHFAKCF